MYTVIVIRHFDPRPSGIHIWLTSLHAVLGLFGKKSQAEKHLRSRGFKRDRGKRDSWSVDDFYDGYHTALVVGRLSRPPLCHALYDRDYYTGEKALKDEQEHRRRVKLGLVPALEEEGVFDFEEAVFGERDE